ncbi:hypothetical protein [Spirosoma spitsbergense]|uniref:hypothetical protein n=1 Tax=Spirosoma spitsbergense TaxID=431554 RepID=UPI0003770A07|nr:hypothetical protein [Spirosoma spitsbergense]
MKTHKWIDPTMEVLVNEEFNFDGDDDTFKDNLIVSAQDIFRSIDSPENPFDHNFTIQQAA